MPRFIKKPVEIEAFQYDGELMLTDATYYVPEWAGKAYEEGTIYFESVSEPGQCFIKTLEGHMLVNVGDYVIQGIQGELYPCKPDIFNATYEKVE